MSMMHMRALWLACIASAVVAVSPAAAAVIGQETAIMGGEAGFIRPSSGGGTVVIDPMPYARTVTCSSYTITGTSTGAGAVTWSAAPSGESGACTGTSTWSCVVDIDPDAAGEGVETITVSRGSASSTVTIGFYVAGAHSCFLSQSVNGTYNVGLVDLDAVTSWSNLGSSGLHVTQGTASMQPTYRTAIVGGQPVVRCDGGDRLAASTASDWTFLHNGTTWTGEAVALRSATTTMVVWGNNSSAVSCAFNSTPSYCARADSTSAWRAIQTNGTGSIGSVTTPASSFASGSFSLLRAGMDAANVYASTNGASDTTSARVSPSTSTTGAIGICQHPGGGGTPALSGDIFRVSIYQFALTSTQRAINKAVDEWALGGTLPVAP